MPEPDSTVRDLPATRSRARAALRLHPGVTVVGPVAAPLRRGRGELAVVFWSALGVYLAAAAFLVLHRHLVTDDAYARVAIAHRMLWSRDPHLAALGFVWGPLPILALLPLVPLSPVWPALTTYGFAASIVSALCMAAAAREIAAFLGEMGVGRRGRLLLTVAFAAHPLVVLYAANGMSEAMFLLFLLMAARRLAGWLRTEDLRLMTGAALALAAAYLARYEALAAGGVAIGLVTQRAYRRTPGAGRRRLEQAACDAAVVGAPVLVAFAGLALISLVITGSPFEQLTSAYGNIALVRALGVSSAAGFQSSPRLASGQLFILEPFAVPLAAMAAFCAWRRRRGAGALAVLGLIGGVLAFMLDSNARGAIGYELRYSITAVPLSVLAAGAALGSTRHQPLTPLARLPGWRAVRRRTPVAVGVTGVLMVASALPVSAYEMTSPALNPSEWGLVRAAYGAQGAAERRATMRFATERRIAADLDAMHLPPGSVLVDDFLGFAVPLNSRNPRQFVITSDRDFQAVLRDPAAAGVTYVLVPEPSGLGRLDAVNRRYPDLYAGGAGEATLVRTYSNRSDRSPASWRLYRWRAQNRAQRSVSPGRQPFRPRR